MLERRVAVVTVEWAVPNVVEMKDPGVLCCVICDLVFIQTQLKS